MSSANLPSPPSGKQRRRPFLRAVLRGFGIVLPPVLTIVIFVWVGSTVQHYVLNPVTDRAGKVLARSLADVRDEDDLPEGAKLLEDGVYEIDGEPYQSIGPAGATEYVPVTVYDTVSEHRGLRPMPDNGEALYRLYVQIRYLQPYVVIPLSVLLFFAAMYLLGRFMAAGIGRVFWNLFERGVHQLPLVRNVYSSVKQVTDFMFSESDIEYTRVVAIEYPRKGLWSVGFVTSEGMLDIRAAANEPLLSVIIPSSPMPVTGYTVTVKKSEAIDLNISVDQAFQFIISCGVVVPPQQLSSPFDAPLTVPSGGTDTSEGLAGPPAPPSEMSSSAGEQI